MKNTLRAILVFLVIIFSTNSYGQETAQDTTILKFVKSNWGVGFSYGIRANTYLNQDIFNTTFLTGGVYSIYWKNLYLNISTFSTDDAKINDDLISDYYYLPKSEPLSINSTNIYLGYNQNIGKKFSTDLNAGFISTKIEKNESFPTIRNAKGWQMGAGTTRYFKLARNNYLGLRLAVDYNTTNYKELYTQLGKGTMNYSLTLSYKGWFRRRIW